MIRVSTGVERVDSELSKCKCYEYHERSHQLRISLPKDWSEDFASETLLVILSHGSETTIYKIPVIVIFEKVSISTIQGPEIQTYAPVELVEQSIWSDTPDFTELIEEIDMNESPKVDIDQ